MKPHEETLDVESIGEGKYIVHARSVIDPPDCARLLAAAPAMARLLLEREWDNYTGDYDECSSCRGERPWEHAAIGKQGGHLPGCEYVAVLRAAGVIE